MKKRLLLIILCCVLVICGGVTSVGCNHSMNNYLKYEMLIDGTYSVGLKEEYLESFTVEITYSGVPVIRKQTVKKGWLYDKVPKNIEIPASYNGKPVTKIADFGFANGNIENVTFMENEFHQSNITQIGVAAFYGTALKKITIPENVKVIEEYAFCDNKLSTLKIPEETQRVGEYAFALNPDLSNVDLGTGIDCIDVGTFCGCDSLTSIVIPKNIRTFKRCAFDYNGTPVNRCVTPLKNLCYEGDDNEWKEVDSDMLPGITDILYYTEDGDISKYIRYDQLIQRVWTWTWKYNPEKDGDIFEKFEKEVEIIALVYDNDNSLEGKTYRFSHSDIEISDDDWKKLLEYDKDDKLSKLLTEDEIEIFKKSNNKEEYKALYDEYALEKYGNVYVVFENGRECMWLDGKPNANSYSYKFVNGKVYSMYSWNDYRYSYTINDGTLMEDYEMKTSGNIKYCRKKFCYREI